MAQLGAIIDKLLTQASDMYVPDGYVSERVLPRVQVKQKTGKLAKYGSNHMRIEHTLMGGRGEARRVESIVRSNTGYSVESHGLEEILTPDDFANVEKPYDAEKDAMIGLTNLIWLSKEKALADTLQSTGTISQNVTLAGTDQYSDYTNSDPIGDWKVARDTVYDSVGKAPNIAIIPWPVFNCLAYHPAILDALGFTQNRSGQLSEAELAKSMGVKRLLVSDAQFDSAAEGQSESRSAVWANDIVFAVAPDRAMPRQTSLGYYITMTGRKPRRVFKFNVNNPPESKGIIVQDDYDFLLSKVNAAYLIKDSIA